MLAGHVNRPTTGETTLARARTPFQPLDRHRSVGGKGTLAGHHWPPPPTHVLRQQGATP
jgi:hypothetical protein